MNQILFTRLRFPEIELATRDAHKLRGYFGSLFREHSPLLHNHYETGKLRYKYPLVQYKVLEGVPTLVAINEGAELLTQLFLKIKRLELDGRTYEVLSKNIESTHVDVGDTDQLQRYQFDTLWMGLNQANHKRYLTLNPQGQQELLNSIIVGNVLSLLKSIGIHLEANQRLMAMTNLKRKSTRFKDRDMIAFEGDFVINALLPSGIGLGKAVSRGFGTILFKP